MTYSNQICDFPREIPTLLLRLPLHLAASTRKTLRRPPQRHIKRIDLWPNGSRFTLEQFHHCGHPVIAQTRGDDAHTERGYSAPFAVADGYGHTRHTFKQAGTAARVAQLGTRSISVRK